MQNKRVIQKLFMVLVYSKTMAQAFGTGPLSSTKNKQDTKVYIQGEKQTRNDVATIKM